MVAHTFRWVTGITNVGIILFSNVTLERAGLGIGGGFEVDGNYGVNLYNIKNYI